MMNREKSVYFQALSMGESGTMVYIAQKILNTIGYEVKEDGKFSIQMENAVKLFQSSIESLTIDGVVGYKTMKEKDEAASIRS